MEQNPPSSAKILDFKTISASTNRVKGVYLENRVGHPNILGISLPVSSPLSSFSHKSRNDLNFFVKRWDMKTSVVKKEVLISRKFESTHSCSTSKKIWFYRTVIMLIRIYCRNEVTSFLIGAKNCDFQFTICKSFQLRSYLKLVFQIIVGNIQFYLETKDVQVKIIHDRKYANTKTIIYAKRAVSSDFSPKNGIMLTLNAHKIFVIEVNILYLNLFIIKTMNGNLRCPNLRILKICNNHISCKFFDVFSMSTFFYQQKISTTLNL